MQKKKKKKKRKKRFLFLLFLLLNRAIERLSGCTSHPFFKFLSDGLVVGGNLVLEIVLYGFSLLLLAMKKMKKESFKVFRDHCFWLFWRMLLVTSIDSVLWVSKLVKKINTAQSYFRSSLVSDLLSGSGVGESRGIVEVGRIQLKFGYRFKSGLDKASIHFKLKSLGKNGKFRRVGSMAGTRQYFSFRRVEPNSLVSTRLRGLELQLASMREGIYHRGIFNSFDRKSLSRRVSLWSETGGTKWSAHVAFFQTDLIFMLNWSIVVGRLNRQGTFRDQFSTQKRQWGAIGYNWDRSPTISQGRELQELYLKNLFGSWAEWSCLVYSYQNGRFKFVGESSSWWRVARDPRGYTGGTWGPGPWIDHWDLVFFWAYNSNGIQVGQEWVLKGIIVSRQLLHDCIYREHLAIQKSQRGAIGSKCSRNATFYLWKEPQEVYLAKSFFLRSPRNCPEWGSPDFSFKSVGDSSFTQGLSRITSFFPSSVGSDWKEESVTFTDHGHRLLHARPSLTRGFRDRLEPARSKGRVKHSLFGVSYVNYVNYVCFVVSLFFSVPLGGDPSLILHQRNFVCGFHHHQLHPSPATFGGLGLSGFRLRRVLCSPTRDVFHSESGFWSLRRVLCLPTRGKDCYQRVATSRLGLFLWIAREVLKDVVWSCTGDFDHSVRRMGSTSVKLQRMSVTTRFDRGLIAFWCVQFPFGASLHSFSKQFPNHTTTGFCVTEVLQIQHVCDGHSSEIQLSNFAGMFRAPVRLLTPMGGYHQVLGLYEKSELRLRIIQKTSRNLHLRLIVLQFSAGRVLTVAGVTTTICATLFVAFSNMIAIAVWPTYITVDISETLRKVVTYVLTRPGRELLFTIVSQDEKYKAKVCIDVIVQRLGDATAAGMYKLMFSMLHKRISIVPLYDLPICFLWIVTAFHLGRRHIHLAKLQAMSVT